MHRRKRPGNREHFGGLNFNLLSNINYLILGGEGGIRTHGTRNMVLLSGVASENPLEFAMCLLAES
jgi:hypothetical protein